MKGPAIDRAGIRAFVELSEDSWHPFPLFFMTLTIEFPITVLQLYLQRELPCFIVKSMLKYIIENIVKNFIQ